MLLISGLDSAALNASTPAAYICGSSALRNRGLLKVRIMVGPWLLLLSSAVMFETGKVRIIACHSLRCSICSNSWEGLNHRRHTAFSSFTFDWKHFHGSAALWFLCQQLLQQDQ